MYLHEKEIVTQIRVYTTVDGYAEKVPYEAIFTVQYISDNLAYIEGLQGTVKIRLVKELINKLKSKGVSTLMYTRGKGMKFVKIS
jgi:hypothetical protein